MAFGALPSLDAAMELLKSLRARLGTLLSGFEILFEPLMSEMVEALGLQAPLLFGGAVILEQIFVIPGMGLLLLEAVGSRDYPTITGVFLVIGVSVVLINLLVDMSYGFLDPKVRNR